MFTDRGPTTLGETAPLRSQSRPPALRTIAALAACTAVVAALSGNEPVTAATAKTTKSTTKATTKSTAKAKTTTTVRRSTDTTAASSRATTTVAVTSPTATTVPGARGSTTTTATAARAGTVFIPGAGRVLDLDANQVARLAAGGRVEADVRGANGLAASGTGTVILDVTVSNPATAGRITLTPVAPDFARTVVTSNLSFPAAATTVTRIAVPVGSGGKVRVATTAGPSGLAIAVVGWVVPAPAGTTEPSATSLEACRLLDTATGVGGLQGEVTPARPFDIPVVGIAKVPPALGGTQVPTGVVLAVGAKDATGPLEVTVVPSGAQSPALVLAMAPAQTTTGHVVIPVGSDARASFFVSQNGVQLSVDVVGWLDRDGVGKSGGPC
jgi:hypothetical protein